MKLQIPAKFTTIKNKQPAFLDDIDLRVEFKKLMASYNPQNELILSFDGSYGENKKKTIHLTDEFFSMLPSVGNITLNFNNFDFCEVDKASKWEWFNLNKLEFNFSNSNYARLSIKPESFNIEQQQTSNPNFFIGCKNLIVNANNCPFGLDIRNKNIEKLKFSTSNKTKDITNYFWLEDLSKTKQIDLSNFTNIENSHFNFITINKNCKWTFPNNYNIKSWVREQSTPITYFNRFIFEQNNNQKNNADNLTTEQLKVKFFNKAKDSKQLSR